MEWAHLPFKISILDPAFCLNMGHQFCSEKYNYFNNKVELLFLIAIYIITITTTFAGCFQKPLSTKVHKYKVRQFTHNDPVRVKLTYSLCKAMMPFFQLDSHMLLAVRTFFSFGNNNKKLQIKVMEHFCNGFLNRNLKTNK